MALAGSDVRVVGACLGRALHADPGPSEDEQVEVQFAWAPALADLTTGRAFQRLERGRSARAPAAGSAPAGTSSATTALRKSGWSVTPTGSVAYSRDTPRRRGRRAAPPSAWTAATRVARASPTFAPRPM